MGISNNVSRRGFLGATGKLTGACAMTGMLGGMASASYASSMGSQGRHQDSDKKDKLTEHHYYLTDVTLEEGFEYEGDIVVGTRTGRHTLEIKDGRITDVIAVGQEPNGQLPRYSARGHLLLPATRDMHIHLDKTFYGGPWRAPRSRQGKTISDMIALEEKLIPQLLPTSRERAEALIALLLSKGSTVARSHCNIDPVSGLKSLEHLQQALDNHRDEFSCEIVAFPQHGLLRADVDGLMREAMQMGVQYVGGLDPTNVDGDMEGSLDAMFQIAIDHDAKIDIHLHETGPSGPAAIRYMMDTVESNPALKGKLTISHAFALSTLDMAEVKELASRFAAQQVTIASTVPIAGLVMPLPTLYEAGVSVMTGTDSVVDHWSPFGTGDVMDKANLYAQLYGGIDEFQLSRAMSIATGGILPLDANGQRAWPRSGDSAEFMLVDASCSAETVARVSPRVATFHQGRLVAGTVHQA
ncbi:amidohydrolase family protein [Halomonas sp. CS7]|uniref:Amidohydrolase family protein n=1 Tax=Halomonas pelophila TaxID=3151122 RepID=A0ABV1N6A8_9GAMM